MQRFQVIHIANQIIQIVIFFQCHDTKHYCTFCSKELGRCKAKCCQFKKMGEKMDEMEDDLEKRLADARDAVL